ncbi:FecCD family ABC transporter permease [Meiothermus granaticius]|uniref:Putative siderophore transport system permease protein YfhA n=1 Tax=Meiothermus granaticius NBRC 107808 TaxID=1227551 RepID=A0A399F8Y8_9DEIN|nr:iron ABC transporter permease [Meiothermus granaticius]RIH91729.1 putative siderophore transport system permease protein YfhA [Meiothermus granaticius NBRC 107808]GEM88425.1 iron ABC transporter permease [Meiothermus granaticius NBRC 107808]
MTHRKSLPSLTLLLLLALALLLIMLISVGVGAIRMSPLEVLKALAGSADAVNIRILYELRLPRVCLGALCGAMFAVSGAILQGVVRNPLASPDVVGVGAGAGLAAVVTLILFPAAPLWALPAGAFAGAGVGFALVYLLARRAGEVAPARVALIGIAVAAALTSFQQLILIRAPDDIGRALTFLVGTVYGADWERCARVLPWAALLLPLSWLLWRRFDVLTLGDHLARGLGMRLEPARLAALTLAVGLAGVAVTGAGVLGFVGLIAPHMARILVGPSFARLLPASMLLGAMLVVGADTLGRGLLPPIEVPAGILTTLLGAPYFLWLLRRTGGIKR